MSNSVELELKELLSSVEANNASDLHLATGRPPILRIDGKLVAVDKPS